MCTAENERELCDGLNCKIGHSHCKGERKCPLWGGGSTPDRFKTRIFSAYLEITFCPSNFSVLYILGHPYNVSADSNNIHLKRLINVDFSLSPEGADEGGR